MIIVTMPPHDIPKFSYNILTILSREYSNCTERLHRSINYTGIRTDYLTLYHIIVCLGATTTDPIRCVSLLFK